MQAVLASPRHRGVQVVAVGQVLGCVGGPPLEPAKLVRVQAERRCQIPPHRFGGDALDGHRSFGEMAGRVESVPHVPIPAARPMPVDAEGWFPVDEDDNRVIPAHQKAVLLAAGCLDQNLAPLRGDRTVERVGDGQREQVRIGHHLGAVVAGVEVPGARVVRGPDLMGSVGSVLGADSASVAAGGSALTGSDPVRGLAADRAPAGCGEMNRCWDDVPLYLLGEHWSMRGAVASVDCGSGRMGQ
jgi:hypothetical protein